MIMPRWHGSLSACGSCWPMQLTKYGNAKIFIGEVGEVVGWILWAFNNFVW